MGGEASSQKRYGYATLLEMTYIILFFLVQWLLEADLGPHNVVSAEAKKAVEGEDLVEDAEEVR